MKRVYLPLMLMFGFLLFQKFTFAQSYGGFRLGLSSANLVVGDEDGDYSDEMKSLLGFHVGFLFDHTFESGFAIEGGLMGGTRGYKMEYDLLGVKGSSRTALFYFDVPVNAMYKLRLDPLTLFAQAGPYFGIGLAGVNHTKVEDTNGDVEEDTKKVEFGVDKGQIRRGDYGLQFGGGIQISSFLIGIYYQLGLANVVAAENPGDAYMKHRVLQISIGAKFGE